MSTIELGDIAQDTVSGFKGVVIARTDWLYGCRRLTIQPQALHDGKPIDPQSFDEPQCALVKSKRQTAKQDTGGPRPEPVKR